MCASIAVILSIRNLIRCFGATLFQIYYYFSTGVALFRIPDRLRNLTQPESPVNNRRHLARLHEVAQDGQIFLIELRQYHDELLAHKR